MQGVAHASSCDECIGPIVEDIVQPRILMVLNYRCVNYAVLLLVLLCSGCGLFLKAKPQSPVHDVLIRDVDFIVPGEIRAAVGEEIRWHNQLSVPIYLGFLGVKPIKEVSCGKGFTTFFGGIADIVTIRAGDYVSACFSRAGTLKYNMWMDLGDPLHSMSPVAVLYLEQAR